LIRLDLADPKAHPGPPPGYLLAPGVAMLVLLPLLLAAGLYQAQKDAVSRAALADRRLAVLAHRAADEDAARQRMRRLQSVLDGAQALREGAAVMLTLPQAVAAHMRPGMRLSEMLVDAGTVRVSGTAGSAGDVSLWFGRSAGHNGALVWEAPEIRSAAAGTGTVEFRLRVRHSPGPHAAAQP
jgi:hypothetical protein